MPTIIKPVTPRAGASVGATPVTTSAKRAPSKAAGASASSNKLSSPPSATNTKAARPTINTKTGASISTASATTKRAASPGKKKRGSSSKRAASKSPADADASTATKATKPAKPVAVGNLYLPVHNLSFASNPLGNKSGKKRSSSVASASAFASMGGTESCATTGSPAASHGFISPPANDFSFSDPKSIYAMSPSRAAATYEKEKINFETAAASRAASPVALGGEDGEPAMLAETTNGGAEADFSGVAPVLQEAPKFKSYFFGHPKPVVEEAPVVEASGAGESNPFSPGAFSSEGATTDGVLSGNTEETDATSREGSPQPAAPAKIVSFDAFLSVATPTGGAGSPDTSAAMSPSMSASSTRSKSGGKKSKSRASSTSSSTKGGKKGKKSSKKAKEPVDPEDCRPPSAVERLFGDVAKSGMTGVPTLASVAIAARRNGSEVDLKAAAAASENGAVVDTSVTPLQTANALFNLGWMHFHALGGCGVNYKKAYAYFYDAATKFDHPMAYYYLGLQLRDGKGVEKNLLAAHDAFQTSLALVGGKNVLPSAAAEEEEETVAPVEGDVSISAAAPAAAAVPFKTLVMPAEITPAPAAATAGSDAEEAADGSDNKGPAPITILNESHKRQQSRVAKTAAKTLSFEGINTADVETVVNWQVGKLWAHGDVVVLEEAPAKAAAAEESMLLSSPASGAIGSSSARAASPSPATPRAASTAAGRGLSVKSAKPGASTATNANKSTASVATTKKGASTSKRAASPKKGKKGAAAVKKDPTNNTGGGPNVVIKRLIAAAEAEAAAAAGPVATGKDGKPYVALEFRKVRYALDKPVAIALFDRCAASGFEHAALAAEILRDVPIPRAELE